MLITEGQTHGNLKEEVNQKITFASVREAFQRYRFDTMPDPILERYKIEEGQYVNYYRHLAENYRSSEGVAMSRATRKCKCPENRISNERTIYEDHFALHLIIS